MIGAGHMMDMNKRIQQNRDLKNARKDRKQKQGFSHHANHGHFNFKTVSEEELKKIKLDIQQKAKKDKKRNIIIFIALLIVVLIPVLLIIF